MLEARLDAFERGRLLMTKSLLFLNALSAQIHPEIGTSVKEQVQVLIANFLDLPLHVVQDHWLDIDMAQVRERYSRGTPRLPSTKEALQALFRQAAWLRHTPPRQCYAVVIAPEQFHVDKIYALRRDAGQVTCQQDPTLIILRQKHSGEPQVSDVIPEIQGNAVFREALQQVRGQIA